MHSPNHASPQHTPVEVHSDWLKDEGVVQILVVFAGPVNPWLASLVDHQGTTQVTQTAGHEVCMREPWWDTSEVVCRCHCTNRWLIHPRMSPSQPLGCYSTSTRRSAIVGSLMEFGIHSGMTHERLMTGSTWLAGGTGHMWLTCRHEWHHGRGPQWPHLNRKTSIARRRRCRCST